jgi:hypothetical protein
VAEQFRRARKKLLWQVGVALLSAHATAGTPPKLPTPCVSNSCGTSAQTFVEYGAAGWGVNGSTLTVTQSTSKAILNWAELPAVSRSILFSPAQPPRFSMKSGARIPASSREISGPMDKSISTIKMGSFSTKAPRSTWRPWSRRR